MGRSGRVPGSPPKGWEGAASPTWRAPSRLLTRFFCACKLCLRLSTPLYYLYIYIYICNGRGKACRRRDAARHASCRKSNRILAASSGVLPHLGVVVTTHVLETREEEETTTTVRTVEWSEFWSVTGGNSTRFRPLHDSCGTVGNGSF